MIETPFIWKHAFPLRVAEDEATAEAARECVAQKMTRHGTTVTITSTTIVHTPADDAAEQYVVRLEGVVFETEEGLT